MNRAAHDHASLTSTDLYGPAWRLACVGYLGASALCSGLAFVGVCRGELGCLGAAGAAGVLAVGLRAVLHRMPAPAEAAEGEEFATGVTGGAATGSEGVCTRAEELAGLLRAWSECERARGTRAFDPWAGQSLRTELRTLVCDDAELRRLLGPEV